MRKVEVWELHKAATDDASRLVADLICDLDDRRGFHLCAVDEETRAAWLDKWEEIARRYLGTATTADPVKG